MWDVSERHKPLLRVNVLVNVCLPMIIIQRPRTKDKQG